MMFEFWNRAFMPLAASNNNTSKAINGSFQISMSLTSPEIHFICTMHLQYLCYYIQRKKKKKVALYKNVVRNKLVYFLRFAEGTPDVH